MSVFDFLSVNSAMINDIDILEKDEKKKRSPFDYTNNIYKIIKKRSNNYVNELDELFKDTEDNGYSFICWILNHNLVYNKLIRENVDWFTGLSMMMTCKEYVYYYTKFMIDNAIKFPEYMQWYKFGIDNYDKLYMYYLKEIKKFNEEEIDEMVNFCNDRGMSIKDICFNLISLDDIILKGEIF